MDILLFEHFKEMLLYDVVENNACIEVEFYVDSSPEYDACWCGKTIDKEKKQATYWYGLVQDGSQAYDYNSLDEFINAPIFHGKSMTEIFSSITLVSIDGCDIDERLNFYRGLEDGPIRGPAEPIK